MVVAVQLVQVALSDDTMYQLVYGEMERPHHRNHLLKAIDYRYS